MLFRSHMTPKSSTGSFALGHWLPASLRRGIIYDLEALKKTLHRNVSGITHFNIGKCDVVFRTPSPVWLTDMYICSDVLSDACGERRVVKIQEVASGSDGERAGR